jgi:hypothetical protein
MKWNWLYTGDNLLHAGATPQALALRRVGIGLIWVAYLLTNPLAVYGRLPTELFQPKGLLRLLPDELWQWLLAPAALAGHQICALVGVVLLTLGLDYRRLVGGITFLLLAGFLGIVRGFSGLYSHGELTLLFATVILVVSPCYATCTPYSVWNGRSPCRACSPTLLTMTAVFLYSYALVAVVRLADGGLALLTSEEFRYMLAARSVHGQDWRLGLALSQIDELRLVWKVAFVAATLMELLAPLCLVHRRFRCFWIAWAFVFHLATWATMNILFLENMLLLPLLVIDSTPRRRAAPPHAAAPQERCDPPWAQAA